MRQWVLRALFLGSFSVLSSGAMANSGFPDVVEQFLEDRGIGKFSDSITCRKIVSKAGTCYSLWFAEGQKPDVLYAKNRELIGLFPRTLILDAQGKPIAEGMDKFFASSSNADDSTVKWVRASTKADGSNGIFVKLAENLFYVGSKTAGILIRNLSRNPAEELSIELRKPGSPNSPSQTKTLKQVSKEADEIVTSFVKLAGDCSQFRDFPEGIAAIFEYISEDTDAQKLSQLGGKKGINVILLKGATGDGKLRKYTPEAQRSLLERVGLGDRSLEMSEPVEYRSGEFEKMQQEAIRRVDEGIVLYLYDEYNNFVRHEKCKSFLWLLNDFINTPKDLLSAIQSVIRYSGNNRDFLSDETYTKTPEVEDLITKYNKNVLNQVDKIHQFFGNIEQQNPKKITSPEAQALYVENLSGGLKDFLLDAISKKIEDLKTTLVTENSQDSEDLKQAKADLNKLDKEKLPERLKQLSSEEGTGKLFGRSFSTLKELSQLFEIVSKVENIQRTVTDEMIGCFSEAEQKKIDVKLSGKIGDVFVKAFTKLEDKKITDLLKQYANKQYKNLKEFCEGNAWNLQAQRELFSVDAITLDRFFELQNTPFAVPGFVLKGKTRPTAEVGSGKSKAGTGSTEG